jgi:hypothetical protein
MSYFKELNAGINKIIEIILNNQDICKLLFYDEYNPLSLPNISNTRSLLMDRVFPLMKNPDSETEQKTILDIYYYSSEPWDKNSGFRQTYICFDIICHLDLWMIESGIRPYSILNEIDMMFNNKKIPILSHNNIWFESCKASRYSDYFYGFHIIYKLTNNSNVGCS